MRKSVLKFLVLLPLFFLSCKKDEKPEPLPEEPVYAYEAGEELSAGVRTIKDESAQAFSYQIPGLDNQQGLDFFVGNSFFNQNWVEAPSSTTARDGLGPLFNARSCAGCHFKDGRGQPFDDKGLLFRLSVSGSNAHGGPLGDGAYGGQLQDHAIQGVGKEGSFSIFYSEQTGNFPDGEPYSLRVPTYSFSELNYGALSANILFSPRVGQQMIGLGLISNINEADLMALSDAGDANGDGISGRINYVYDAVSKSTRPGRFGWKANTADLYDQAASAFLGDLGITSWLYRDQNCSSVQNDCQNAINGGLPEIDSTNLNAVVLYTKVLGVPQRRNVTDPEVLKGKYIFRNAGCESCHVSKFTTGNTSDLTALNGVVIRPYSDFLLHDMGEALSDHRPDYQAAGNEWRTQPLWGLGLIKTVNGHSFLLHDGRARGIQEAILWHGGEAAAAKNYYMQLEKKERDAVLKFLESL